MVLSGKYHVIFFCQDLKRIFFGNCCRKKNDFSHAGKILLDNRRMTFILMPDLFSCTGDVSPGAGDAVLFCTCVPQINDG